jgi:hypothetical protein
MTEHLAVCAIERRIESSPLVKVENYGAGHKTHRWTFVLLLMERG